MPNPTPSAPFRRGKFEDLPQTPRIAHRFFETEALDVDVQWPQDRTTPIRVRKHGAGPPLLLVHGLMTSSYSWRYAIEELGKSFTCYAPDLPGAGDTAPVLDASYAPVSLAEFLGATLRALGIEDCVCIANSMGGYIAVVGVLDGTLPVSRLIQLHGPGRPDFRFTALKTAFALPGTRALFHALVKRDPLRWCHRNVHYFDESLKSLEEAREYGRPLQTREGREALRKYLCETMGVDAMRAFDLELRARVARGESFPVPIQLVYAEQDPMVPPTVGPWYHERIPDAEMVWMKDASHFAHVDATDRFVALAEAFLNAPPPAAS